MRKKIVYPVTHEALERMNGYELDRIKIRSTWIGFMAGFFVGAIIMALGAFLLIVLTATI